MTAASQAPIAQTLRRLRLAAGLSQEELAERAGLSARGVSDLERGLRSTPRPDTVRRLADALGLGPDERAALIAVVHPELLDAPVAVSPGHPSTGTVRTLSLAPLPLQSTRLVGREREAAASRSLLLSDDVRLVTLTGPGGVGKTRLAIELAGELAGEARFGDGVAFVELAPVRDPALVADTVGGAFGVYESGDRPVIDSLREALGDRRFLLVVDSFEHVLPAAPLLAELLAGAPGLTVLATSRGRLHLQGERETPIEPLPLPLPPRRETRDVRRESDPRPAHDSRLASRVSSDAVRLFVERAVEREPGFGLTDANADIVGEIVRRLDGLPLAIELAAARLPALPPASLLGWLEQRLPAPSDDERAGPARQRTLRDTVAWSYHLLSPREQSLFRRVAVFAGSFTREEAEAVWGAEGVGDDLGLRSAVHDLAAALASLVDKHLLQRVFGPEGGGDTEPRYSMQETIREFGLERLAARGEE